MTRYCFEFDLYFCPYCERWQVNEPDCTTCEHGVMHPLAPEQLGQGMFAAWLPDAIKNGRVRIEPQTPETGNPKPELARLLADFFTGTSSQGSLAAVHIHPRSPSGSALIVRPWQGNSELSDRALAAQLEPFIRQLLEVRRESHNQAEDLTTEDTENTKGETGNG